MQPPLPQPSFSNQRRWRIAVHVLVSIVAALAIVVMVNYLASRHYNRYQLSQADRNQLSPYTLRMLSTLTNTVKVMIFFDKDDPSSLFSQVSSLLKEYQLASPRIEVQHIEFNHNPGQAQFLKDRYKQFFPGLDEEISQKNLLIFDSGNRPPRIVFEKELADYDHSSILRGEAPKRTSFKGEQVFTSTILSVIDPKQVRAYYLEGHEEHNLESDNDQEGYSKFASLLRLLNLELAPLSLLDRDVPEDCNLLIMAGPKRRFEPEELARLESYLNRDGRVLILLRNNTHKIGLEQLLARWGIAAGEDIVLHIKDSRADDYQNADNYDFSIITTNYPSPGHPIIKPLLDSRLQLLIPRSVDRLSTLRQDADSPKVEILLASGANGIACSRFHNNAISPSSLDRQGVIPLAVALEKGGVQGISAERGSTRMVVVGDSLFLANNLINSAANQDFAVLAVNWLLDRSNLMGGIGPRAIKEFKLIMTYGELMAVRWLLLAVFPGAVFSLGVLVWLRRRS